ncbi:MAG: TlpA family protein disulfide reductase [Planctomycetaceae bacterium]|nr:TlpA family protein disulfide reductase [Planctomycetaceae bacterium]
MTFNLGRRWRQIRVYAVPLILVLIVAALLVADGLRSRAIQRSKYEVPADHSAPRMLEFMREMDGSVQTEGLVESSNALSVFKAIRQAYEYLENDSQSLTEAERREAEFCHLKFWGGSLINGSLPATEDELRSYLAANRSFIASAPNFGVRESRVSSEAVLLLAEILGKLAEAKSFGHWLLGQLAQRSEFSTDSARITARKVESVMNRLEMIDTILQLQSFTVDDKQFDIQSLRGKVVLLEFWGVHCAPCIADIPALKRIHSTYKDRGFEIVGIAVHAASARIKNFASQHQLPWVQLCDDKTAGEECNQRIADRFGIEAIPTTILMDQSGKVVALGVRPLVGDPKRDLESWLQDLLTK